MGSLNRKLKRNQRLGRLSSEPFAANNVCHGRVDEIRNGTAFVTLFHSDKEPIAVPFSEGLLTRAGIGVADLFELTMMSKGNEIISVSFRKVERKRIPDELAAQIKRLKEAYTEILVDES